MSKKLITCLVVVALLISLSTFSLAAQDKAFLDWCKAVKAQYNGTTITVAAATHPSIDAFQKMTPEFTELTGINVKWDTRNELSLRDKVMMDYSAHTGTYDVLMTDCVWVGEFAEKKIVIPLDNYIQNKSLTPVWYDYNDVIPAYREGLAKWKGNTYGLVSAGQTSLLGYRKDLFQKYGVDPKSITTFDKLLEVAKFFNGKEDGLYGISMRGERGHNIIVGWFTIMYPFGGRLFDANWKVLINSPEAVKSLDYFISLLKNAPPGVEAYNSEEQCAAVARGDVAMGLDVSACPPYYEPAGSVAAGKMGYLPVPSGPKGDFAANAGWLLAISNDSKNKDAAWPLMVYMTSKQKVKDFLSTGGDINRTSTFKDPDILKSRPYAQPTLVSLGKAMKLVAAGVPQWRPAIPEWSKIGEILGYEVNAALIGNETSKEALDKAAKGISELMNESGY